ncbi:MAG: LysR family transcriptional regulator [Clostridia bacterium]|nr:LysR family transcriptional regulator [Clostridia bacterium]
MTDLKRFEYALALAEVKNFSQAADKLGISQSSLSQYIRKLENELGVLLFERTSPSVKLTQSGEIYVKGARKILDEYSGIIDNIADADNGLYGTVCVGISPSRAPFLLPDIVNEFRTVFPDVTLKFIESKSKDIIRNLNDGTIDFAYTVSCDAGIDGELTVTPIADEEIMLVCSKQSKLNEKVKNGKIDFTEVKDFPFIVLEDDQLLTNDFFEICRECTVTPKVSISVSEISTAIAFAARDLGIMLLPSSYRYYGDLKNQLNFLSVKQGASQRKISIIYRKDKYLNRPTLALIDILSRVP